MNNPIASVALTCGSPAALLAVIVAFPSARPIGIGAVLAVTGAVLGHRARRRHEPHPGGYDLALTCAVAGWALVVLALLLTGANAVADSLDAGTS